MKSLSLFEKLRGKRNSKSEVAKQVNGRRKSPGRVIALGFLLLVLLGTSLLMLPISTKSGQSPEFIDALFTATSASCVTGLVVHDTRDYWSTFGHFVIIILIQIGGLGIMTIASSVALVMGKRFSLENRLILGESIGEDYSSGVVRLLKHIVIMTFIIELIGAISFATYYIPKHGWSAGIMHAIFHSISSFCNAGFDLVGDGRSAMDFVSNPLMSMTIMMLIILGGIGFTVIMDVRRVKGKFNRLSLNSKIVLTMTSVLICSGTLIIFMFEYFNPATIGELPLWNKILASAFHSVSARTAGINTLPMDELQMPTMFTIIILMVIGGSPSSAAGGIKTTTFSVLVLAVISVLRGRNKVVIFNRTIPKDLVFKALVVLMVYMSLLILGTMILCVTDSDKEFLRLLFEMTSALGTVGHSVNTTHALSDGGKLTVVIFMLIGRIGPLTLFISLTKKKIGQNRVSYPEGRLMVG